MRAPTLLLVLAGLTGCATTTPFPPQAAGPQAAEVPRKQNRPRMSQAQKLALATGINKERGEPYADVEAEGAPDKAGKASGEGSALGKAAAFKDGEVAIEALSAASIAAGPAVVGSLLSGMSPDSNPSEDPGVFIWTKEPPDGKAVAQMKRSLQRTVETRYEAQLDKSGYLRYRYTSRTGEKQDAILGFLGGDYAPYDIGRVAKGRVPPTIPQDHTYLQWSQLSIRFKDSNEEQYKQLRRGLTPGSRQRSSTRRCRTTCRRTWSSSASSRSLTRDPTHRELSFRCSSRTARSMPLSSRPSLKMGGSLVYLP